MSAAKSGGEILVETFLASGLDTCFANPGTSEMHFVAALDANPDMRCILCLFEGGASGAADGYARMSGRIAATLFHLGPGFGNAWANLHNARKGGTGVVNVVGDHATAHLAYDAPLTSDLDGIAGSVSHWTRRVADASSVAHDGAAAIRAARSGGGQIATLILPADAAWSETESAPVKAAPAAKRAAPEPDRIAAAAAALRQPGTVLLVGGEGLWGAPAEDAGRLAASTGCRIAAPFFATRIARGSGAVAFEQMRYFHADNAAFFGGTKRILCVGEKPPVGFFAYPSQPSTPEPPGCNIEQLCPPGGDVAGTLAALVAATDADAAKPPRIEPDLPDPATGPLDPDAVGRTLARHLPEGAICVNEAVTAGFGIWPHVDGAAPHDRINNTGGSIGQCLPNALGAAVACPDRPVYAVTGDGSAMYQLQTLWTMAREQLDVTSIVLSNGGYRILHLELQNLGLPAAGRNARALFDVADPALDWPALAQGHGVPAARARTAEDLAAALDEARAKPGPFLIEAVME